MPTASPKPRARRAPREKPGWPWRLLSWSAAAFAVVALLGTICSIRWDLTWRISHNIMAGTRTGALKVFKDWHGNPSLGMGVTRHTADVDWAGRWLYDTSLGWYEVPLWFAILIALVPSFTLWHFGLKWRTRLKFRRGTAWALLALAVLLLIALTLSVWWQATLTQPGASMTVSRTAATFEVTNSKDRIMIGGSTKWDLVRTSTAKPILLPTWTDTGTSSTLVLPIWIPMLTLLASAALLRRLGHLDPRSLPGHCSGCGYARQGLSQQAPCPECGAPSEQEITGAAP
jgi:hypothetical protein